MFCPSCATEVNDQTKYCTKCGLDLRHVKDAISKGGAGNFSRPDHAFWEEIALEEHREKRRRTPEEKRLNEIKAGIITSSVGLSVMIFLYFLLGPVANGLGDPAQGIIRAIPFVGIIPFFIGIGIIFNGWIIGKRIVDLKRGRNDGTRNPSFSPVPQTAPVQQLPEASQTPVSDFSITEPTTTKLREHLPVSTTRDTN
jgi:hypothetical protein